MLIIAIAAVGWLFQSTPSQEPSPKLTFQAPAAPAKRLFPALSQALKLQLETSPQTQDDVLLIRVKGVEPKDLLAKIAEVVHGTWKKEPNCLRLIRTPEQVREEELSEQRSRTKLIQAELDRASSEYAQLQKFDQGTANLLAKEFVQAIQNYVPPVPGAPFPESRRRLQAGTPTQRMLKGVMASLDAKELCALKANRRLVYSNKPGVWQRALPRPAIEAIRRALAEQALWEDAKEKLGGGQFESLNGARVLPDELGNQSPYQSDGSSQPKPGPLDRVIVALSDWGDNICWLKIRLADARGQLMSTLETPVTLWTPPATVSTRQLDDRSPKIAVPSGYARLYGSDGKLRPNIAPIVEALRPDLTQPTKVEPLEVINGPILTTLAELKGLNLVAHLSDSMVLCHKLDPDNPPTCDQYLRDQDGGTAKIELQDGWLLVRPSEPYSERLGRIDRTVLGTILRKEPREFLSLEEQAARALALKGRYDNELLSLDGILNARPSLNLQQNPALLALYASLTPSQRASAMDEKGLLLSRLSQVQSKWIEALIHDGDSALRFEVPMDDTSEGLQKRDQEFSNSIFTEPSEYLKLGVPNSARLKLSTDGEPAVFSLDEPTPAGTGQVVFPLWEYTQYRAQRDHPELVRRQENEIIVNPPKMMQVGIHRTIAAVIEFEPNIRWQGELVESLVTIPGRFTHDRLPPDFLKLFAGAYKERLEQMKEEMRNGTPTTAPAKPGVIPPQRSPR